MIVCQTIDVRKLAEADEPRFIVTIDDVLIAVTDRRKVSRDIPWAVQIWGDDLAPIDYRTEQCLVTCSQKIDRAVAYAHGNAAIDTCKAFLDEFGEQSIPEIFNFIASIGRDSNFYTDQLRARYPVPSKQPPLELRKYLIRAYEKGEVWQDKPSPVDSENPWQVELSLESSRLTSATSSR
ncbi:MAG: hypothetical protein J7641_15810 [Cyanobacteria bacterium SID2]|nr:hypothetical protein [Cyanobacteria bacterium SID2]